MNPKLIKGIFLQFSAIVGAGIFALPYLFYHSNFNSSIFFLICFTLVTGILNYFYIDVILHTSGDHQFSGYIQKHLGDKFKIWGLISIFLISCGAIFAYLKLAGIFLTILIPSLSPLLAILIFLFILTLVNLLRLKPSGIYFEILPLITLILILFIFYNSFYFSNPINNNIFSFNLDFFGVLIFSLSGFTVIPEIEELFRGSSNKKSLLKISSTIGLILASIIYIIFTYSIIKISGLKLSPDAVSGIIHSYPFLGKILAVLGLIVIFKASLNYILVLKEIFYRDLNFKKNTSYTLSFLIPFAVLFLLKVSFVNIISLTGSIAIGLSYIFICLMRFKLPHNFKN